MGITVCVVRYRTLRVKSLLELGRGERGAKPVSPTLGADTSSPGDETVADIYI